jgi:hypothetical protein
MKTRGSTIDRRFAGTVAGTSPSTAHQIRLNLLADARISFHFRAARLPAPSVAAG